MPWEARTGQSLPFEIEFACFFTPAEIATIQVLCTQDRSEASKKVLEKIVCLARQPSDSPLTERQSQALAHTANGLTIPTMAKVMGVAHSTARTHCERMRWELGVGNKAEAVAQGILRGLLVWSPE